MNKIRLLLFIFLMTSLGWILTGCSLLPQTSLEIVQYHLEKTVIDGKLTAQIVGVAGNDGSARLEYAEIEGNFYSQDSTLLATGFAKTISEEGESFTLDLGQIWNFTIPCPQSPVEPGYPSLKVLECVLLNDSTEAKLVGSAENDGNVTLAFVKLTGHFLDANGNELTPTGAVTTTDLEVGTIWNFTIYFPRYDVDLPQDGYVKIEDTDKDLQAAEAPSAADEVTHVTVKVETLRGSSVMP